MTALATLADYATKFGAPPDQNAVNAALDAASAQIRSYLHQQISYTANHSVVLSGNNTDRLILPERPVISVASVTYDKNGDNETPVTDFVVESDMLMRCNGWRWGYGNFTVVYTHGYQVIPADIKNVTLVLARDLHDAVPVGLRSETIAGYSYSRDAGAANVAAYGVILDPYRPGR